VALGITLIYGYQTFIIVGGVIKLIPLTGVTLPFISYGGTSLISAFIAFGIMQAISKKTLEGEEVALIGE
jgi:cell division protein FtsW (lipid II flippase)